jgi:PAS domain S-box-containing protein
MAVDEKLSVGAEKKLDDPVGRRSNLFERFYIFIIGHPRYRGRQRIPMPRRARIYIYGIALAGAGALALTEWLDWGEPIQRRWLFVLFSLYVIFDHTLQFSIFRGGTQGVGVRLEEGLLVCMALLFPPWTILPVFLLAGVITFMIRDTAYIRTFFNNGQLMISIAAALGVFRLFGVHPWDNFDWRSLVAALLCALTFFLISNCLVAVVIALVQERPVLKETKANFSWSIWYFFFSSLSIGLLTGIVALYSRWAIIVAFGGAVMLVIALRARTTAITDRERMLTLLEATRRMHQSVVPEEVHQELVSSGAKLLRCEGLILASEPASGDGERISSPMQGAMEGRHLVAVKKLGTEYWSVGDERLLEALAQVGSSALTNAMSFEEAESERRKLADILNFSSDAILVTDPAGHIVGWNPAMSLLVGVAEREAFGESAAALASAHPLYEELLARPKEDDPQAQIVEIAREAQATQALSVARSRTPDGSVITVVRDESARLELERVFDERKGEKMRSDLVSMVSHELRTPLTSIIGFSQFLLQREVAPEDSKRYLETIYNEANRLSALLNDFLDLQRVKEGRFTLEQSPFDLAATAAEVITLLSRQSDIHVLKLDGETSVVASGDRARIHQVVQNLLSNAIKYSPEGGEVIVRVLRGFDTARLEVVDSGLGIPETAQASLFTKFYRVSDEARRGIGGTGLGLALCKEIIDAHGGKIGFQPNEGPGSMFWFELSLA